MNIERLTMIGLSALVIKEIGRFGFSFDVREKIRKRAGHKSELSGTPDEVERCECAHIDHNRENPDYNNPENGIYMTVTEHLIDHLTRAGANGLSEEHNNMAIRSLESRVIKEHGKPYLWDLYDSLREESA